ncbi:MAG: hypothetical protein LBQ12_07695, partial [Deltaproteobacteria bacterium]|nr:hypothetical protein [Deltaproteobacteria bacterium]
MRRLRAGLEGLDEDDFRELAGMDSLLELCSKRSASFLSMDWRPPGPPMPDQHDLLSATRNLDVQPPLPRPGDEGAGRGPMEEEARALFVNVTAAASARSTEAGAKAAGELSAAFKLASGPDGYGALRWLLLSAAKLALAFPYLELTDVVSRLELLPPRPEYGAELAEALASAALRGLRFGGSASEADRLLSVALELAPQGGRDPFSLYAALSERAAKPLKAAYGPGEPLRGRASSLANALSLAPLLREPDQASFLPCRLLASEGDSALGQHDLDLAATLGFPETASFRLSWEALSVEIGIPRSAPKAPREALEALERLAEDGAAEAFGKGSGPGFTASVLASRVFGRRLAGMDRGETERAVRLIAPLRAKGEVSARSFFLLFSSAKVNSPAAYQRAVLRAAGD